MKYLIAGRKALLQQNLCARIATGGSAGAHDRLKQLHGLAGQVLGQAGQVTVVDAAVAVHVQGGFDAFHVLACQILRQTGQVAVVDVAVAVDVAGGVRLRGFFTWPLADEGRLVRYREIAVVPGGA